MMMRPDHRRFAFASSRTESVAACLALAVVLVDVVPSIAAEDLLQGYTLQEVSAHDSLASCWMAIEGEVYDVTAHVAMHPTEPAIIARWCGRDATEGMRTKGIGEAHSPAAWGLLDLYRIGTLQGED